jgi:ABC-type bacteriocin/lantibiotic exporter with double-glycine peptidase domain
LSLRRGKLARLARLEVPHVYQGPESNDCVPAAVLMVVRYYKEKMGIGDGLPNPDLHDLKRVMDTDEDGTMLRNVPKADHLLKGRSHMLEFKAKQHADLRAIKKEIDAGRPVIVVIKPKRGMRLGHSMVVKGLDATHLKITFDDPASVEGHREMEQTEFLREWGNSGNVLIEARLDRKPPQKELEEFATE